MYKPLSTYNALVVIYCFYQLLGNILCQGAVIDLIYFLHLTLRVYHSIIFTPSDILGITHYAMYLQATTIALGIFM